MRRGAVSGEAQAVEDSGGREWNRDSRDPLKPSGASGADKNVLGEHPPDEIPPAQTIRLGTRYHGAAWLRSEKRNHWIATAPMIFLLPMTLWSLALQAWWAATSTTPDVVLAGLAAILIPLALAIVSEAAAKGFRVAGTYCTRQIKETSSIG